MKMPNEKIIFWKSDKKELRKSFKYIKNRLKKVKLGYKLPSTSEYDRPAPNSGHLISIKDYLRNVEDGSLINYDGSGAPSKNNMMSQSNIYPSDYDLKIPLDATHILWSNR